MYPTAIKTFLCGVFFSGQPAGCDRHRHLGQGVDEIVNLDPIQFTDKIFIWLGFVRGGPGPESFQGGDGVQH